MNTIDEETEAVIYGKILDPNELSNCYSSVDMNQLQATLGKDKRCRCRYEKEGDTETYTHTVNVKKVGEAGIPTNIEYNFPVDASFFKYFKSLSEEYHVKKRHMFKLEHPTFEVTTPDGVVSLVVPDLICEIDVFEKEDGTKSDWCKIDIELDSTLDHIENIYPEATKANLLVTYNMLPIRLANAFLDSNATDEQKEIKKSLWENEFSRKTK